MKATALAVAAAALFAAAPGAAEAPPAPDAMRLGAAIRAGAQAHFGLWDRERRARFAAAWEQYRDAAAHATQREAVDLAAIRLVASLHDAQSWFDDPAFEADRRRRLPFVLRYADGGWIVTESRSDAIPDGAVLREIDGMPAERFAALHRDLLPASSETQGRTLLAREIRLVDGDAHPPHLTFDENRELVPPPAVEPAPPRVTFRWLVVDRIGYVAIPAFGAADERDALAALKHFIAADALVVDVRGNGGGVTPVDLLELLTDRPLPWWRESSDAPQPARTPASAGRIPPADGHFRGRVVVVADERCAGPCEDFVMPLVASHRARFVGSATYGSTGESYVQPLGGGMRVAFGSIRAALPDGGRFEGVGIVPTDPVPLRLADVRAHADAQLDRALAIAERAQ